MAETTYLVEAQLPPVSQEIADALIRDGINDIRRRYETFLPCRLTMTRAAGAGRLSKKLDGASGIVLQPCSLDEQGQLVHGIAITREAGDARGYRFTPGANGLLVTSGFRFDGAPLEPTLDMLAAAHRRMAQADYTRWALEVPYRLNPDVPVQMGSVATNTHPQLELLNSVEHPAHTVAWQSAGHQAALFK